MTRQEFSDLAKRGIVLLDGATGSNLRAAGMPVGVCVEDWVLSHPDVIIDLQTRYADAGSDIIYAPTFGANTANLSMYGMADRAADMNRRLVDLTRRAVGDRARIAGDMTTLGKPADAPDGYTYDAMVEIYAAQARALCDAGVDLFAVETMLGVTECCAAIEAIRAECDMPIICTLTLDGVGMAYFDGDAESAAAHLPAMGADAIGVNCGQGPELFENVVRTLAVGGVPVVAKPNAGLPQVQPDGTCIYSMTPTRFARAMGALVRAGATIIGGCCGTNPDYIYALAQFRNMELT